MVHHDAIVTSLRRLMFIDLSIAIAHTGLWIALGIVTPTVALLTNAVRVSAWLFYAWRQLEPARSWLAHADADDDARLLAAHRALDRHGRRVAQAHLVGWLINDAAWLVLARLGIPDELAVGDAELLVTVLLASSLLLAPLLIEPVTDHALDRLHTEVRTRLATRRVTTELGGPTISRAITRLIVAVFCATLSGLAAPGVLLRVDAIRAATRAEQQRIVETTALRMDAGADALPDAVEIVERDALPPELLAAIDSQDAVAVHNPRRGLVLAAAPLSDGRWVLSRARPDEQLGLSMLLVLGLMAVIAPVFVLAGWAYGRSITQPLDDFARLMERFSSHGELRGLTRTVSPRGGTLGRLSANFNRMLDILEELADAAATVAKGDLSVDLERSGELQDAFRGMLSRLNQIVGRMRETSLEVASAAAEIQALTLQQQASATQQSSGMQQVSATVASLADAASRIATTAQGVLDNAEQTVVTTDTMTEKIAALRSHAASVTALLEVIREVAARSDLLALNGSLEATRAGEAGRGFALVSAEMRRLAERVSRTVDDVRVQVSDIELSGTDTVAATEQSRKLAQQTAVAARQISVDTGQQSTDTRDVAGGVQELAKSLDAATAAVAQTHAAAEGLRTHATELERLLATFRTRASA